MREVHGLCASQACAFAGYTGMEANVCQCVCMIDTIKDATGSECVAAEDGGSPAPQS